MLENSENPREEIANRLAHMCGSIDSYSNIFVIATNRDEQDNSTKITFFGHSDVNGNLELYGLSNMFSTLIDVYIYNYASEKFNTFSVGYEPEDYKELCTVVAHLLICNKMLLLHIDENYRRLNEPTPSN